MTAQVPEPGAGSGDILAAAAICAVDPYGIGGAVLRAHAGPVRDAWLDLLRRLSPESMPLVRVPLHIDDDRLLGGLDLSATLATGRPVRQPGVLVRADGGIVLLAMAERIAVAAAARIVAVMDAGALAGPDDRSVVPARFGVVALDEGDGDERPARTLLDRLALHLDLDAVPWREAALFAPFPGCDRATVERARAMLSSVTTPAEAIEALCTAAARLGIGSLRVPVLALRVARASAALDGRTAVDPEDLELAARLVLAPRATILPGAAEPPPADDPPAQTRDEDAPDPPRPPPDSAAPEQRPEPPAGAEKEPEDEPAAANLEDIVLAAARAVVPADLLAGLAASARPGAARTSGRSGETRWSTARGRPAGSRRTQRISGARIDLIATLRAAAPWQNIRRRASARSSNPDRIARVLVQRDDLHVVRYRERSETVTVFVVDASGSSALHRLGEAKGAVELVLADCYVRRDRVALIAFRGQGAELLLPPTRSLARAKRSLAGLPGGGGTPLAAAIEAAHTLCDGLARSGIATTVVLLTDGRANVALDGGHDRDRATSDALHAATRLAATGASMVLVDTSPRPHAAAQVLAARLRARYVALPRADAHTLARVVQGQPV